MMGLNYGNTFSVYYMLIIIIYTYETNIRHGGHFGRAFGNSGLSRGRAYLIPKFNRS